jgi:translation elongation factor EF-Ts
MGPSAALVALETQSTKLSDFEDLGRKIAMHVVASKPSYLSEESVPGNLACAKLFFHTFSKPLYWLAKKSYSLSRRKKVESRMQLYKKW